MKNDKSSNGIKYYKIKNQIILIGGYHYENFKSFEMFDITKNKFIEYPQTLEKHSRKPGIIIENNNLIYIIGDYFSHNSWGMIECFDIRRESGRASDQSGDGRRASLACLLRRQIRRRSSDGRSGFRYGATRIQRSRIRSGGRAAFHSRDGRAVRASRCFDLSFGRDYGGGSRGCGQGDDTDPLPFRSR